MMKHNLESSPELMEPCLRCGSVEEVQLRHPGTYHPRPVLDYWDHVRLQGDDPPDPNPPIPLCYRCHVKRHTEIQEAVTQMLNRMQELHPDIKVIGHLNEPGYQVCQANPTVGPLEINIVKMG